MLDAKFLFQLQTRLLAKPARPDSSREEVQRAGHPHAALAQTAVAAQTALLKAIKG